MKKPLLFILLISYSLMVFSFLDDDDDDEEYIFDGVKVERLANLQQLSALAKKNKKAIVLEFTAEYCAFCIKLENEVLKPMIRSHDYENKMYLRSVYLDLHDKIIGWDGQIITAETLTQKYNVFVTPTVIIIDDKGNEIAERQIGINLVDYYAQYLDIEIDKAVLIMQK